MPSFEDTLILAHSFRIASTRQSLIDFVNISKTLPKVEDLSVLCYNDTMLRRASIYASFLLLLGLLNPIASFGATKLVASGIDLDVENVGMLPTSPFYFLKELRRDFMRMFTKDPVAEAFLELQIVNETAGELNKVQEFKSNDVSAITKSIEKYKTAQKRLSAKLDEIKKLPKGRASDKLVEELASKAVSHERFLRSLEESYINQKELKQLTESAKEELGKTTQAISKAAPAKELVRAVRRTLTSTTTPVASDDATKQEIIRSVISNLEEGAPENLKISFIELRNELTSTSTITTSTVDIATSTIIITTSTAVTTSTERNQLPLSL